MSPEMVEYPDSGKRAAAAELPPGPDGKPRVVRFIRKGETSLDEYWEGE